MTETQGQYFDTLPDGRVLIASYLPESADETNVRLFWYDHEQITPDQRKKIFAIVKDISLSQMEDSEYIRKSLIADFLRKNMENLQMSALSLAVSGNCDKGTASLFIDYLIAICLDFGIQTSRPLQEYADDIQKYSYSCLSRKKCCICGRKADLHHVDAIGMGYNRHEKPQLGNRVLPLCREHHSEAHNIGNAAFMSKYHLETVCLDERLAKVYGLTQRAAS